MDLIRRIRDRGLTVLLIEHDMELVMGVTDRIVVLDFGEKIAEGCPTEVAAQPEGDRRLPGRAGRCCLSSRTSVLDYGKIEALHGISLDVDEGEVVALIGANGAGKTTTLRAISGMRGLHVGHGHLRRRGRHRGCAPTSGCGRGCAWPPRAAASSRA